MQARRLGIDNYRRQRNDKVSFTVLDFIMTYLLLLLCHNEIHYSEPFGSLTDAEDKAISLANEWYREDGVRSFGLSRIRTIDDMRDYYGSDSYLNSGDSAHVVIESAMLPFGAKI